MKCSTNLDFGVFFVILDIILRILLLNNTKFQEKQIKYPLDFGGVIWFKEDKTD